MSFKRRTDAIDFFSTILKNIDLQNNGVYMHLRQCFILNEEKKSLAIVNVSDTLVVEDPVFYNQKTKEVENVPKGVEFKSLFVNTVSQKKYNIVFNKDDIIKNVIEHYGSTAKRKKVRTKVLIEGDRMIFDMAPLKKRSQLPSFSFFVNVENKDGIFGEFFIYLEDFFWILNYFFEENMIQCSVSQKCFYFSSSSESGKLASIINNVDDIEIV